MPSNASKPALTNWLRENLVHVSAWSFIAVVVAGSLVCASCAHTPAGLDREQVIYGLTSNAVVSLNHIAPYAPPPCNSILEGVLATGGALLALWATHLQRSLKEVRNGNLPNTVASSRQPPGPNSPVPPLPPV
jgi:hypothetical protein